ncbi:MAG: FkbM family methyltransferase [Chthoniobacterales bacterium]|nr:FkbM family methyltransferase [Chthoniobacterales bacterium]
MYDGVFDLSKLETFAYLGCNRGLFSLWLAANSRPNLRGLLVEANPHLISYIQKLFQKNDIKNFTIIHGAIGAGIGKKETEFLIPSTGVGAGLVEIMKKRQGNDRCESVFVPCLNLNKVWESHFGSTRCDLLKIDIE